MKKKFDIITLYNHSYFKHCPFSANENGYCQRVGTKMVSVLPLSCRFKPYALTKAAEHCLDQGVRTLALPQSAAQKLKNQYSLFAADGRLLILALWRELLPYSNQELKEMTIGVNTDSRSGRLLARIVATELKNITLCGNPMTTADTAQQIYQESGVIIRNNKPNIMMLPPGEETTINTDNSELINKLSIETMNSESGSVPIHLAEALLLTTIDNKPTNALALLKKLRKTTYHCNYYPADLNIIQNKRR